MSLRRPLFWSLFALLALVCTVFAIQYFPRAFPLVNLDIRMDRGGALQEARLLAEKLQLGPPEFEQAASFGLDGEVQNFVELEGGGKEAFNRLLGQELYSPYTWRVRHYREKETDESLLLFTPAGRPYGFVEKIPEDEPGAALPSDQARTIAEAAALREWKIDVGSYDRVEDSRQVRPGGRVDHTFVYEHPRRDIGGGRYRLRLTVSGDKPTEVTRFIKIPEGFQRRYQEMRSANQTIGTAASLAMAVLYILGGCVIGLFLLLRKGWVLWRQAVVLGVSLSLLQALAAINEWPLAWMDYDTALSIRGFVLQQTTSVLVRFGGLAILLSLSFMAAESLTRRAFPGQIQFWKIGSPGVANSPAVLGRTVAGYLLVPLFFGYEVTLYLFANRALGWWSPSNILFHPDVLATYFPWLSAIAPSLQAGFWEECLFRAVPLAGAALIGEKMGRRRAWIVGALVVQALIFGAGHAAYPNQPALARVVELIVPSLCFGGLYLSFGLLPSIILHFAFDTVWFAMPLFVASAPGLGLDKVLLVVLSLTPLWIVLAARIRAGRWNDAIDKQLNGEWTPPLKPPPEVETPPPWQAPSRSARLSPVTRRVLQTGGLIGIATWALWGNFQNDAPPLPLTRQQALEVARGALSRQSGATLESWTELAFVQANPDQQHQFIWQTAGDETYRSLLGSYLSPPLWVVRFAKFDQGDTEERAEEFRVYIRPDGQVWRFLHQLPEARSGASFSEQDARELALSAVSAKYKLQPSQLKEISAQPAKLPDRLDWTFTFSDKTQPLPRGETRIGVGIGGAKVVDLYRHVHVPEDWIREERNRRTITNIVRVLSTLVLVAVFLAGAVGAVVKWSRWRFSVATAVVFFILLFVVQLLSFSNNWPATRATFSTAQPVGHQVLGVLGPGLIGFLFLALFVGLNLGMVKRWKDWRGHRASGGRIWTGLSLGILGSAVAAIVSAFGSSRSPKWADYSAAQTYLPEFQAPLTALASYILLTSVLLLTLVALDRYSRGWRRKKALSSILLVGLGFTAMATSIETLSQWILSGILLGAGFLLAYVFVLRFDLSLIPLAMAATVIMGQLRQAIFQPYPTAVVAGCLAMAVVALVGYGWWRSLNPPQDPTAAAPS